MAAASLAGWTIGVTADRRAEEQAALLARRGARVVLGPVLRTVAVDAGDGLADAIDALVAAPPDLVVLTTGIGVRAWFDAAEALGRGAALQAALAGAVGLARGPKAAGAAHTAGLAVAWQAPGATGVELLARLGASGVAGRRVAVQLDGRERPVLGDAVRRLGADVVPVPVYRWTDPDDDGPAQRLVTAVCEDRIDAVTFTAAPAVERLVTVAGTLGRHGELLEALADAVAAVSVGPVCTAAARRVGVHPTVEPERARLGAMVQALADHAGAADRDAAVAVGRASVVLRAAVAVVDDRTVELPAREWAVLAALLERPGAVVSKEQLGRVAWGNADGDPAGHAVEAAVGRLRRRVAGLLDVRVVPRRGYLLTAA